MENKAFKVAGIKNLMTRNYKLPDDVLDLESLIDDNITMAENWHNNVKRKVKKLISKEELLMYRAMWQ